MAIAGLCVTLRSERPVLGAGLGGPGPRWLLFPATVQQLAVEFAGRGGSRQQVWVRSFQLLRGLSFAPRCPTYPDAEKPIQSCVATKRRTELRPPAPSSGLHCAKAAKGALDRCQLSGSQQDQATSVRETGSLTLCYLPCVSHKNW